MKKRGFVNSILSKMGKRGLSTIVITLIIILISLVAVGIVWVVVRNVIQTGTKEVTIGQFTLDAKIKNVNIFNSSNNVSLTLKRNPGVGEFNKMNFVFYDGKNSEVITQPVSLNELEEKWFMFHLGTINVSNLISVSIFPYVKQDEKEILGNILDKYTVSGQGSIIPVCAPLINNYCSTMGFVCGSWGNGTCGGNLNCGACGGATPVCNSSGRCVASCTPLINNYCSTMVYECGYWGNSSCSGNLSCGTCGTQATCPSGTCVCNSGWADCNNDNTCECDLSSNSCSGGNCVANTGWKFDWGVRTDMYGKPVGMFAQTPFPINETTTEYSIKNDEYPNGKTYYLGTKYYVDGMTGVNSGNCQNFASPCRTIIYAITQAGSGNKAIIIRGAYGSFNGIYNESNIEPLTGINDTNRFILVGYNQERPIIDGTNAPNWAHLIFASGDYYITVQRLKLQNNVEDCIYGSDYVNSIDLEMFNCTNRPTYGGGNSNGDGLLYFAGTNYTWIFHNTAHRTYGHGYKLSDGTSNAIIEWSTAYECGWWSGVTEQSYNLEKNYSHHPIGINFQDHLGYIGNSNTARYNIVYDVFDYPFAAVDNRNFSFHHNEFYDPWRCINIMTDTYNKCYMTGEAYFTAQIRAEGGESSGSFYSNIVRNSNGNGSQGEWGVFEIVGPSSGGNINIFNNIFYDDRNSEQAIWLHAGITNSNISIYSNSFYMNNTDTIIDDQYTGTVILRDNIFYQAGTGSIISGTQTHDYNLYYAPFGSIGVTLGTGEINSNPLFQSIPSGAYSVGEGAITSGSPARNNGTSLSFLFTTDFNGVSRPQGSAWDIGAFEYV